MVIPLAQHKEGVLEAASALLDRLKAAGIRASIHTTPLASQENRGKTLLGQ